MQCELRNYLSNGFCIVPHGAHDAIHHRPSPKGYSRPDQTMWPTDAEPAEFDFSTRFFIRILQHSFLNLDTWEPNDRTWCYKNGGIRTRMHQSRPTIGMLWRQLGPPCTGEDFSMSWPRVTRCMSDTGTSYVFRWRRSLQHAWPLYGS